MIVILLFNLLFRSVSSFRGVRRTVVQMPRGSRFQKHQMLTWPTTGP